MRAVKCRGPVFGLPCTLCLTVHEKASSVNVGKYLHNIFHLWSLLPQPNHDHWLPTRHLCNKTYVPFLPVARFYYLVHSFWPANNTWFLGPTHVHMPNGISMGSVRFAGLSVVTHRPISVSCLAFQSCTIIKILSLGNELMGWQMTLVRPSSRSAWGRSTPFPSFPLVHSLPHLLLFFAFSLFLFLIRFNYFLLLSIPSHFVPESSHTVSRPEVAGGDRTWV